MQRVFQALSKLLILWVAQRQNEICPWRLYERAYNNTPLGAADLPQALLWQIAFANPDLPHASLYERTCN